MIFNILSWSGWLQDWNSSAAPAMRLRKRQKRVNAADQMSTLNLSDMSPYDLHANGPPYLAHSAPLETRSMALLWSPRDLALPAGSPTGWVMTPWGCTAGRKQSAPPWSDCCPSSVTGERISCGQNHVDGPGRRWTGGGRFHHWDDPSTILDPQQEDNWYGVYINGWLYLDGWIGINLNRWTYIIEVYPNDTWI